MALSNALSPPDREILKLRRFSLQNITRELGMNRDYKPNYSVPDGSPHRNNVSTGAAMVEDKLNVLVVDDEKLMCDILTMSLQRLGYAVVTASNGVDAIDLFDSQHFDLLLLDVMMPNMDGFEVCTEIRKRSDVPIIMLTALSRPDDIVRGLEAGADNYITKPFTFKEVEARIKAILRRTVQTAEQTSFVITELGDLKMNDEIHEVTVEDEYVELTRTEYRLLQYLMHHPNQTLSKEDLLNNVWGYEIADSPNLVELAVRRLRKKIEEDASNPKRLVTVRGFGYKLTDGIQKKRNRDRTAEETSVGATT